jgi:hypothetical protein
MPDPTPPPEPPAHGASEPVNPDVRFERKDANVRAIVWFAVGLAAVAAATHLLLTPLFDRMEWRKKPAGSVEPRLTEDRLRLPKDLQRVPEPRLQINQELDLNALRKYEETFLQSYAWVDPGKGVVRIPIERALEILTDPKQAAAHGIRVRPEGEAPSGPGAAKTRGPRTVPPFRPGTMKAGREAESVRPARPGKGEGR